MPDELGGTSASCPPSGKNRMAAAAPFRYSYKYLCMYVNVSRCMCMYINIYECMQMYVLVSACMCMWVGIYECIDVYVNV